MTEYSGHDYKGYCDHKEHYENKGVADPPPFRRFGEFRHFPEFREEVPFFEESPFLFRESPFFFRESPFFRRRFR
jgi:hypothetical protein